MPRVAAHATSWRRGSRVAHGCRDRRAARGLGTVGALRHGAGGHEGADGGDVPRQYITDYGKFTLMEQVRLLRWKLPSWRLGRALGAVPTQSPPMKVAFPMAEKEVPE